MRKNKRNGDPMDCPQLKNFLAWGNSNKNVRALILTGSIANSDVKTDALSDFDLELYVEDLSPFERDDQWIERFGDILVRWPYTPQTTWSPEWITRLIQFKDGIRFDFQITDTLPSYHSNFDVGYKVLIDKNNYTAGIANPKTSNLIIKKPSEKDFLERVNAFYWNTLYVAKCLWRDEIFYAKYMLDNVIRFESFQVFIEWYIGLHNHWSVTTNKFGRYFKQFLDPHLWHEIEKTFCGAMPEHNWNALYQMIEVTHYLCKEIADHLHYPYPEEMKSNILDYITRIRNMDITPDIEK